MTIKYCVYKCMAKGNCSKSQCIVFVVGDAPPESCLYPVWKGKKVFNWKRL